MNISLREKEVLELIAHEYTSKEIAQKLLISNHTALSHRKNFIENLGVRNTTGLVRRGYELGLLKLNCTLGAALSIPLTTSVTK